MSIRTMFKKLLHGSSSVEEDESKAKKESQKPATKSTVTPSDGIGVGSGCGSSSSFEQERMANNKSKVAMTLYFICFRLAVRATNLRIARQFVQYSGTKSAKTCRSKIHENSL